jgi:DHA3 family multidrug efflux protein-like MFS transporter
MKKFYSILINNLFALFANSYLWFGVTFWAYLQTKSIFVTAIIGGTYPLLATICGIIFGAFVDRHKKKISMMFSSLITLIAFCAAAMVYGLVSTPHLLAANDVAFWVIIVLVVVGAIAGNLRNIALSTVVGLLVDRSKQAKANGMVGTVSGISFALTSVFSGLSIGYLGLGPTIVIAICITIASLIHLSSINMEKDRINSKDTQGKFLDFHNTYSQVKRIPGLSMLILFTTFNNFLAGIYIALLDPYGLSLVSVQAWGVILAIMSSGLILGSLFVAAKGLGRSPLKALFYANVGMWIFCILFPMYASAILLTAGLFLNTCLVPVAEAAEQTLIQQVVPIEVQGRVFGFAQSVESAAAPLAAYLIGPIAVFGAIPFMTDGLGAQWIGSWFGTGEARGMAFVFVGAGIIGLIVTVATMLTKQYKALEMSSTNETVVS